MTNMRYGQIFEIQLAEERRQALEKANRERLAEKEKRASMVKYKYRNEYKYRYYYKYKYNTIEGGWQRMRREQRW